MTFAARKYWTFLPVSALQMVSLSGSVLSGAILCGNLIGEAGLAAANLLQGVFELIAFLEVLVGTGAGVLFAKELGAFHQRRARGYFTVGVLFAAVLGLLFAGVSAFVRQPVVGAFDASSDVSFHALRFWLGLLPGMAIAPLSSYFLALCYADGGSRLSIIACVARLIATWTFAYPLTRALGAAGCAVGYFCGQLAQLLVLCLHFRSPRCMLGFSGRFPWLSVRRSPCPSAACPIRLWLLRP